MQKFLSKYATAAHLAIMAAAPFFLFPFFGERVTATTLLWMVPFGLFWILLEPSRRPYELPHEARARVTTEMSHDPFFWFSLVLVGYAALRAFNDGVMMAYDAEQASWSLCPPRFPILPGCMKGTGFLPFAGVLALLVLLQGIRHALGRSARMAFLLVSSFLSSFAAVSILMAQSFGIGGLEGLMECSWLKADFLGMAFGVQLLAAIVAYFGTVENHWAQAELFGAFALVGNAVGLVAFAPVTDVAVFALAFLLLVVSSFFLMRNVFEGSGSFRCAIMILLAISAPVLYVWAAEPSSALGLRLQAALAMKPLPDWFLGVREKLSGIALRSWLQHPWTGSGLGSFALDIRFVATPADWVQVSGAQLTALNGGWQILAERGVVGALFIVVLLGFLFWTYFSRLIRAFRHIDFSPIHLLGPIVFLSITAISFVECSAFRVEVLLTALAAMALSGTAFPVKRRRRESEEGKDS